MKALILLAICFIGIFIFFYSMGDYTTISSFTHRDDHPCFEPLPDEYKLVYSDTEKEYAIIFHKNRTPYYLWYTYSGVYDYSGSPYTTFSDSCTAKSVAWDFISQSNAEYLKNNSYK